MGLGRDIFSNRQCNCSRGMYSSLHENRADYRNEGILELAYLPTALRLNECEVKLRQDTQCCGKSRKKIA